MPEYVLDPVGEESPPVKRASLAPRLETLKGKRVALLDDRVTRSIGGIDNVKRCVEEQLKPGAVRVWVKPTNGRPAPQQLLDDIAKTCDAVILACCA